MKTMTIDEFHKKGEELFGEKARNWEFVCPNCQTVQSGKNFLDLGMKGEEIQKYIGFSCIGRFNDCKTGCDWTLGGLFQCHKMIVIDEKGKEHPRFEFNEVRVINKEGKKE